MPERVRLRAIMRNATMWGVVWGLLGTVIATILRITDGIPLPNAIGDGIGMGIRIGIFGGMVGALFAAFIAFAYRGKRLREINALRFGIIAAVLIGLFIPLFLQSMNLLSGQPLVPWSLLFDDLIMGIVFGGITAGGSMKLAQSAAGRDETADADDAHIRRPDAREGDALGAGDATHVKAPRRAENYERQLPTDES